MIGVEIEKYEELVIFIQKKTRFNPKYGHFRGNKIIIISICGRKTAWSTMLIIRSLLVLLEAIDLSVKVHISKKYE